MSENGKIVLIADDGSEEAFFVVEKVVIAGASYLLVTNSQSEEEDGDALILKQLCEDEEVTYDVVDDEKELTIISKYFEELLEDVELSVEE